ncbi:MAG: galactose ABC transporter substrate-binding protein [Clostridium sp.]|uniref:galactose ABC transporter substrate-binding protein n=1 Tax=Clostridium sp. TaxID=1506 RepID=UPI002A8629F8|nr:galactose ABC transporter substrate-binding protein [Clostridium sp.]MDY5096965.1 galactose ABC transporter substrate-binding protein [Clostridium sp.]
MDKWYNKILLGISIMSMAGALTSCDIKNQSIKSTKEMKIGVTLYKQDDMFISNVAKSVEEYAKTKGANENSEINVNVVYANGSSLEQNNQVDKFIKQGYDAICVNMVDRTEAAVIVEKCKKADIPLIFFNREPVEEDMYLWNKAYYIGGMAKQSGELQGEIIVDAYKRDKNYVDKNGDGKVQYVMLEGEQEHQDTLLRTEYCIKTVNESGIELQKLADETANWQSSQGNSKMAKWISEYGTDIEVVFCNNDAMALGAIAALKDTKIEKNKRPLVVGIDGIPEAIKEIEEGNMEGTVINNYVKQAEAIIDSAYDVITKGQVTSIYGLRSGKYIDVPHEKFTKENLK